MKKNSTKSKEHLLVELDELVVIAGNADGYQREDD